jgi:hypothetical protein
LQKIPDLFSLFLPPEWIFFTLRGDTVSFARAG